LVTTDFSLRLGDVPSLSDLFFFLAGLEIVPLLLFLCSLMRLAPSVFLLVFSLFHLVAAAPSFLSFLFVRLNFSLFGFLYNP